MENIPVHIPEVNGARNEPGSVKLYPMSGRSGNYPLVLRASLPHGTAFPGIVMVERDLSCGPFVEDYSSLVSMIADSLIQQI